ncbi:MAG: hypothetical protein DRP58_10275, partial [Spirochaetes bacterium]
ISIADPTINQNLEMGDILVEAQMPKKLIPATRIITAITAIQLSIKTCSNFLNKINAFRFLFLVLDCGDSRGADSISGIISSGG